jgi:hypothetical protein
MKKLLILFSIFCLVIFSALGQENVLYFEIQQAKNASVFFESVVLSEVSADAKALEKFINANEVFFFGNMTFNAKNNETKALSLAIPVKNRNMILELLEVPDSFYDYEVITSDGRKFSANKDIRHFRGVVKDDTNSLVAITIYNNEIKGLVCADEGNFNIVKDSQSGKHLFFNENNLTEKTSWTCATVDDLSFSYEPEVLFKQRNNLRGQTTTQSRVISKEVGFYVETEYDIYQAHGNNILAVESFISGLFNQVAILYDNEDILTSISCMYIWTSDDPYTGTDIVTLLSEFQNARTSIIGDLGMLLTFRNIAGRGIAAGFEGLCNSSTSKKLAISRIETNYETFPVYSGSVFVITHEFGHLLGSRHTHACVWNGNNTAIDGCEPPEGDCFPPIVNPPGTIMSYCSDVNFNLGFGPQPGNVIRNSVINASCLQACNTLNFTNQTITSAIIINSCGNINVQNVTVTNNANLKLETSGNITINGSFKVEPGASLKIKK